MATEDILINDGDSFISLSALAAEQVDVNLPIESVDGTVTLDSPSANTFTVSTDGKTRFEALSNFESLVSLGNSVTIKAHTGTNILVGAGGYIQMSDQLRIGVQDAAGVNPGLANRSDPATGIALGTGSVELQVSIPSDPDDEDSSLIPKTVLNLGRNAATLAADYYPDRNSPKSIVTVDYLEGNRFPAYSDDKTIGVFAGVDSNSPDSSTANQFVINSFKPDADSANTVINVFAIDEESAVFVPPIRVNEIQGRQASTDASIWLGAELLTTNHTPTQPNSIATKQIVDDKIWVGTTAAYNQISPKNPTTLYCLTD